MENLLGKNWKTALSAILTTISLIPSAINNLGLAELPEWLRTTSLICAFVSFIYGGIQQKDKSVTGIGKDAVSEEDIKKTDHSS